MTNDLKTKSPPKDGLEYLDVPIKADAWVNLYFSIEGKCNYAPYIHPSEQEAIYWQNRWSNFWRAHPEINLTSCDYINGYNFSHTIAMPWGGK